MHEQLAMQPAMELGAAARGMAALQPPHQCLCSPFHGWVPVQGMQPALHTCSQPQPWDKPFCHFCQLPSFLMCFVPHSAQRGTQL